MPKYLDRVLEERGATRLAAMGTSDVAHESVIPDLTAWEDFVFWPAMRARYGVGTEAETQEFEMQEPETQEHEIEKHEMEEVEETALHVSVSAPRSSAFRCNFCGARVQGVRTLYSIEPTSKAYMDFRPPPDMTYSAGDWLAVLPRNPSATVRRALKYFGIARDSLLTFSSTAPTTLPTEMSTNAAEVFGAYVELAEPATRRYFQVLLGATHDHATKTELTRLQGEGCNQDISLKQVSFLDLLERFPAVRISLGIFLSMQPLVRVWEYGITSHPLESPNCVTFTYSCAYWPPVDGQRHAVGPGSAYLSSLDIGDKVSVSARGGAHAFHLPEDANDVPLIMVTTGTGTTPSAPSFDIESQATLTLLQT